MKSLAIAKKVMLELLRDKRAVAMLLVAPILVMFLLNVAFNTSSTTNVKIAVVGVSQSVKDTLNNTKHVSVKTYSSNTKAQAALKKESVDAVIQKTSSNHYTITYANTDSSKTALTKSAFSSAVVSAKTNSLAKLAAKLKVQVAALSAKLSKATGKTVATSTPSINTSSVKITSHYNYGNKDTGYFAKMLPILLGFFVFFFVFLISGMALLKERSSGTLDRLLATPVKRSDIVWGYMISYGIFALIQTSVVVATAVLMLGMEVAGSLWLVFLVNFVMALVALAFGLLMSTLASSEFQLMQFIPVIVMPQVFFSGIISLSAMPDWVQWLSKILPLTYAGNALSNVILHGSNFSDVAGDLGALCIFLVILVALNIIGLKRYRKV